ncbi:hypothetical protein, partial [Thermococcus sp. GR7]
VIWLYVSPNNYSVWPHAFGFVLFLIFVSISIGKMQKISSASLLILLGLIGVSVNSISYTSEMWIISFLIFAVIVNKIFQKILHHGVRHDLSLVLGLATTLTVGFIYFNNIIWDQYLPGVTYNLKTGQIWEIIRYSFGMLSGKTAPEIIP